MSVPLNFIVRLSFNSLRLVPPIVNVSPLTVITSYLFTIGAAFTLKSVAIVNTLPAYLNNRFPFG